MTTSAAEDGLAALAVLERGGVDVVLTDVQMPRMTGPELLDRVKAERYPVEVIMMTAFADIPTTVSAVKAGAFGFLTKPFVSLEPVVIEVLNAAERRRLLRKNQELERALAHAPEYPELLGACPEMRALSRLVTGVATTNSTILILGESGTGKELVARAVHGRSRRADKPLITVNCAALPHDLVESELFGHLRGAFTNALSARQGLFEAANGGTLFLDEIGELPMNVQVKLLRAIQFGELRPVGSDVVKHVDVRILAATNTNLKAAIAAGRFRQDLFYRLNVITLELPPLRDRGDDELILAHHFVRKHAALVGRPALRLGNDAAACLRAYSWPGNVRELEHAIERGVVLSEGDFISPAALPAEVREAAGEPSGVAVGAASDVVESAHDALASPASASMAGLLEAFGMGALTYAEAKRRILLDFNAAYVAALIRGTERNMSEAARRSGLDRANFRRLVRMTTVGPVSPAAPRRGRA